MSVLGDSKAAFVSGETWGHYLASVSLGHGMGLLLVTTCDPLLPRCCFFLLPFSWALRELQAGENQTHLQPHFLHLYVQRYCILADLSLY